jgi:hypothetical protein
VTEVSVMAYRVQAAEDVLVTFRERILLFIHPSSTRQRRDGSIDAEAPQQRFGLPVQQTE